MNDVRIWRVYNNGMIKNETRVLGPHIDSDGIKRSGYGGDISAWSEHNKVYRFGCAQIVRYGADEPEVLYSGYLDEDQLSVAVEKIKGGRL